MFCVSGNCDKTAVIGLSVVLATVIVVVIILVVIIVVLLRRPSSSPRYTMHTSCFLSSHNV